VFSPTTTITRTVIAASDKLIEFLGPNKNAHSQTLNNRNQRLKQCAVFIDDSYVALSFARLFVAQLSIVW